MKKIMLYLILILILSLVLQIWTGVVITGKVSGIVSIIIKEDATLPTIISYTIEPKVAIKGENVYLDMEAIDNVGVSSKYVNITTPTNNTIISNLPYTYNASTNGEYKVIFLTKDILNNTASAESKFIVANPIKVNNKIKGPKNKTIDVNFTVYYPNSNLKIKEGHNENGTISLILPEYVFDLDFKMRDGSLELKLKNINISAETENTVRLSKLETPVEGYTISYGIDTDYKVNESVLKISYKRIVYSNENNLSVWKCEDWDFDNEKCLGIFKIIAAIQDKTEDSFIIELNNFSGFSIKETTISSIPPTETYWYGGASYFYKEEKPKEEVPEEKITAKRPEQEEVPEKEISKEIAKKQFNKIIIIIVETPIKLLIMLTFALSLITAVLLMHFLYKQYIMPMPRRYKS